MSLVPLDSFQALGSGSHFMGSNGPIFLACCHGENTTYKWPPFVISREWKFCQNHCLRDLSSQMRSRILNQWIAVISIWMIVRIWIIIVKKSRKPDEINKNYVKTFLIFWIKTISQNKSFHIDLVDLISFSWFLDNGYLG